MVIVSAIEFPKCQPVSLSYNQDQIDKVNVVHKKWNVSPLCKTPTNAPTILTPKLPAQNLVSFPPSLNSTNLTPWGIFLNTCSSFFQWPDGATLTSEWNEQPEILFLYWSRRWASMKYSPSQSERDVNLKGISISCTVDITTFRVSFRLIRIILKLDIFLISQFRFTSRYNNLTV